jgi:hypothetical protein
MMAACICKALATMPTATRRKEPRAKSTGKFLLRINIIQYSKHHNSRFQIASMEHLSDSAILA